MQLSPTILSNKHLQKSILTVCFLMICSAVIAQPRDIKNAIKQVESEKGVFSAQVSGKTLDEAREKARKQIESKIFAKFRISDPIPVSLEDEMDGQALRRRLMSLPMNAKEFTWGKKGDESIYLYVTDFEAKNYAVQRATIQYRNSQDFSFGEGFATVENDAIGAARGNLITQFSAKITSETNLTTSERTLEVNQKGVSVRTESELKTEEKNGKINEEFKSKNNVTEFDDNVAGTDRKSVV